MNEKLTQISAKSRAFFTNLEQLFSGVYSTVKNARSDEGQFPQNKDEFESWAQSRFNGVKREDSEGTPGLVESFKDLVTTLGVSESMVQNFFDDDEEQSAEHLYTEAGSVISVLLGWSAHQQAQFKEKTDQYGGAEIYQSPIAGLIAHVGVALGYHKLYNVEGGNKSFLSNFVGMDLSSVIPGGFLVSLVAAFTAAILVNRKYNINRSVEEQILEYYTKFNVSTIGDKLESVYKKTPFYGRAV